jgi:hypothetical protein
MPLRQLTTVKLQVLSANAGEVNSCKAESGGQAVPPDCGLRMKTRRRRLLIVLVGITVAACVWFACKTATTRADMMLAFEIQKLNGTPFFDDEVDGKNASRTFPRLKAVAFYARSHVSDSDLAILRRFPVLEELFFAHVNITDDGLASVAELKSLRTLVITAVPVTDNGIRKLGALVNLRYLGIEDTLVTPSGFDELRKALPDCTIQYENPAHE